MTPSTTAPPPPGTVTEQVAGILTDVQRLARQQMDMFKAEVREDLDRTRHALGIGAVGAVLLTIGGLALVFGLVNLLHEEAGLSMWAAWMIFAAVGIVAGGAAAAYARHMFETFTPLPAKSFTALEENLTWTTQPQPQA